MQDLIKSIVNSFQILFRYAYPGFLFVALLNLAGIQNPFVCTDIFGQSDQTWSLIAIYLLISFIIYNLHRFFLHEYLLIIFFALGIIAPGKDCKKEGRIPTLQKWLLMVSAGLILLGLIFCFILEICFGLLILIIIFNILMIIWFVKTSNYMFFYRKFIKRRTKAGSEFNNYLDIRWATTHAIGITWWLPALIYKYGAHNFSKSGFIFMHWKEFWFAILILLSIWIYQVITLSFVEHEFLNSEHSREIW